MNDIIHLLPDNIANQIAAGEVIQRPSSVVKELVENAVDAGSTHIQVNIKDAGRTLIQVIDNGKGMSETDARMAFERHGLEKSGKAGRSRWLGRRPHNRGVVMNPVDHPMGGGEGRASGGHPRSRTGLYAKGLKTRAPKKHSSKYIIERRKK